MGIKPTYGRCSRFGIVAFASSLDQAGPIAKTVEDAAILLRSMAGHDPKDSTSLNVPTPDFAAAIGKSVKGLRIGVPEDYRIDGMPEEIAALGPGHRMAEGAPAARSSRCGCRTPSTPCRPITSSPRPRPRRNLARYDGMRFGLREPGASLTETYENTPRRGLRAARCSGGS